MQAMVLIMSLLGLANIRMEGMFLKNLGLLGVSSIRCTFQIPKRKMKELMLSHTDLLLFTILWDITSSNVRKWSDNKRLKYIQNIASSFGI